MQATIARLWIPLRTKRTPCCRLDEIETLRADGLNNRPFSRVRQGAEALSHRTLPLRLLHRARMLQCCRQKDAQIAHMQAQLLAAHNAQATLQQRVIELERLLSIQQQQQIALSALNGLGPQALALAASGLLPGLASLRAGTAIGPLPAQGPPAALAMNLIGTGQPPNGTMLPISTEAVTAPSSGSGGSPPQSTSPRSSPSPPQRASPTPAVEAHELPAPMRIPSGSLPEVGTCSEPEVCCRTNAEVPTNEAPIKQLHATATATASSVQPAAPQVQPESEPEASNMLELLCTVAGREAKPGDGSPTSPDRPSVLGRHEVHRPSSHRHPQEMLPAGQSEGDGSPNDRLAKALAGVGAAGSLARIRQQSAALAAKTAPSWHGLEVKRQRVGY